MTKEEFLIRELCREVTRAGIHTDRFTQLWMESGVELEDQEFEVANRILQRYEENSKTIRQCQRQVH